MNIEDVKRKIADHERDTANGATVSVDDIRQIRKVVSDTASQRVTIIARKRRKLLSADRLAEMKARHMTEMLALKREIAEAVEAFDRNPDHALHEHIADFLGVDVAKVPAMIEGCRQMDEYERNLWVEYRSPR